MFFITILYVIIGGIALLGAFSLMKNGPRHAVLNLTMGIAQILLLIILLKVGHYYYDLFMCILLFLSLIGICNLIAGFCRKWIINFILGISQIILFSIML